MSERPQKRFVVHSNAARKCAANAVEPPKRLVSKGKYLQAVGKKVGLCCLAGLLVSAAIYLLTSPATWLNHAQSNGVSLVLGAITILALWCSLRLFEKGRQIEPGRPLTDHTVHLLPPEETLVRASDIPPSLQPTELLRAVQTDSETPPEELLRASITNSQE